MDMKNILGNMAKALDETIEPHVVRETRLLSVSEQKFREGLTEFARMESDLADARRLLDAAMLEKEYLNTQLAAQALALSSALAEREVALKSERNILGHYVKLRTCFRVFRQQMADVKNNIDRYCDENLPADPPPPKDIEERIALLENSSPPTQPEG